LSVVIDFANKVIFIQTSAAGIAEVSWRRKYTAFYR